VAPEVSGRRPVALVTGASRGIGSAIVEALAGSGYDVALLARDASAVDAVSERLRRHGGRTVAAGLDVTDASAVRAFVDDVVDRLGGIDLLVNNAGLIEPERPLWQADPEQWWSVLETNVRGPFLLTHAVVPHMLAAGGGRIVNLNSGAGAREYADLSAYSASKAALARLTGAVHEAGAGHRIRAFDLAPGHVRTDMTLSMELHDGRTEWTPVSAVTDLVLALGSGELDAWSGRFVRAGTDTPASLRATAASGLGPDDRKLRLRPCGAGDPLATA
jgi:NAD(P)-dependent dehydrogenase (short-subunit alcohol dehydrogenase family)